MDDILSMVKRQLGGSTLSSISRSIGADEKTTSGAIGATLPLLVGALARNAADPQHAARLHAAVVADHDGSLLDDLAPFLGNPGAANGAGILRHMFGDREMRVEKGVARGTGLNGAQAAQLLQILAPIVMAALGRTQRAKNLDPGGLAGTLQGAAGGGALGGLAGLLDADKDGSIVDDLGKLAGSFFGKKR